MFCVSVSGDSMLRVIFNSSSSFCGSNGFMSMVSHRSSCMFFIFVPCVLSSVAIVFESSVSSEMVPALKVNSLQKRILFWLQLVWMASVSEVSM